MNHVYTQVKGAGDMSIELARMGYGKGASNIGKAGTRLFGTALRVLPGIARSTVNSIRWLSTISRAAAGTSLSFLGPFGLVVGLGGALLSLLEDPDIKQATPEEMENYRKTGRFLPSMSEEEKEYWKAEREAWLKENPPSERERIINSGDATAWKIYLRVMKAQEAELAKNSKLNHEYKIQLEALRVKRERLEFFLDQIARRKQIIARNVAQQGFTNTANYREVPLGGGGTSVPTNNPTPKPGPGGRPDNRGDRRGGGGFVTPDLKWVPEALNPFNLDGRSTAKRRYSYTPYKAGIRKKKSSTQRR